MNSARSLSEPCQQNVGHGHRVQQPNDVGTDPPKATWYLYQLPNVMAGFQTSAASPELCQGAGFWCFPPVVWIPMPGARSRQRGERWSRTTSQGRLVAARLQEGPNLIWRWKGLLPGE